MSNLEQLLCPFYGYVLGNVNELVPSVIPFSRVAFRVFVRHHASHCLHRRPACKVFRGYHFKPFFLPCLLILQRLFYFPVRFLQAFLVHLLHLTLFLSSVALQTKTAQYSTRNLSSRTLCICQCAPP